MSERIKKMNRRDFLRTVGVVSLVFLLGGGKEREQMVVTSDELAKGISPTDRFWIATVEMKEWHSEYSKKMEALREKLFPSDQAHVITNYDGKNASEAIFDICITRNLGDGKYVALWGKEKGKWTERPTTVPSGKLEELSAYEGATNASFVYLPDNRVVLARGWKQSEFGVVPSEFSYPPKDKGTWHEFEVVS